MKKLLSTTIAGLLLVLVTSTSLAYPHIDEALPSGVLTVYANAAMLYKSQPESREASIKADIVIKSNDISKVEVCIKPLNKVKIPELTFKGRVPLQNGKRTGKQGKEGPLCCLPPCEPCWLHTWQARWLGATLRLLGRFVPKPL